MSEVLALVVFSFVSSVTPGPNNVILWASGARFGFRATIPHVAGTALGIGALAAGAAVGIAALLTAVPSSALALRLAGTGYLVWLAYGIATGGSLGTRQVARPLGLGQAIVFQFLNPKGWLFALAAISTYRLRDVPVVVGSGAVVLVMMAVVVPSAAVWAAGGSALRPLLSDPRRYRIMSVALAALLAATIALLWL